MNTYDNDTKFCNNSDKTSIPNDPNTIKEVIHENSDLIYEIAVNIDRLQHNLFGIGGSLDDAEFPNNFSCLYDEVSTQNSELKSIVEMVNFIKGRLLG